MAGPEEERVTLTTPELQNEDLRVVVLLVDDQRIIAEAVRLV